MGQPSEKDAFTQVYFLEKEALFLMCVLLKVIRRKVLHDNTEQSTLLHFVKKKSLGLKKAEAGARARSWLYPSAVLFASSRGLRKCPSRFTI